MENKELQPLMNELRGWASATFPTQTVLGKVKHLEKEVKELIEALEEAAEKGADDSVGVGEFGRYIKAANEEFADCFLLLIDAANLHGMKSKQLTVVTSRHLQGLTPLERVQTYLKPIVKELREELEDIEIAIYDDKISVDVFLNIQGIPNNQFHSCFHVLIRAAEEFGLGNTRILQEAKQKLEINKKRKWGELNAEGFSEHIKE
jgi:NTP pyrophosphatase (non-canonical NTP hydrolase)